MLAVDNRRLIASAALGLPTLAVLALLVAVVVAVALDSAVGAVVAPSLVSPLLVLVLAAGRRVVAEWALTVSEADDGLHVRGGLLQTRTETIPTGRIQGIRLTRPLLWRPWRWYRLEVDVARQRSGRRGNEADNAAVVRALLPVGTSAEAEVLLSRVFPGAVVWPPPDTSPPRRARLVAPLSWWALRAWHDGRYVAGRTGRLTWRTVIVPMTKIQSVRWRQGPLRRALRLAGVYVDTAGRRWRVAARCRDATEADRLLLDLPRLARAAQEPTTPS